MRPVMPRFRPFSGLAALATTLAFALGTPDASAEPAPPPWRELIIGLPPLLDLALLEGAPFGAPTNASPSPFDATQRAAARRRATIHRDIVGHLQGLDLVTAHTDDALRQELHRTPFLEGKWALGGERFDIGRERWLSLEVEEALTHFDRARQLYQEAFVDLLVPERFAEVEFHRGIVLAELDRESDALAAFRAMFLFDPSRRFTLGWFGPRVDALLTTAAADARNVRDPAGERFPQARLRALGDVLNINHWLIVVIAPASKPDGAARLDLDMLAFDNPPAVGTRSGSFELVESAPPFIEPSPFSVPDLVNRWFTAWHVCALDREVPPLGWRPEGRRTLFLDLAYRHEVWLNHRQTRLPLHGPGFQLGVQWEPDPLVQLWARLGQVTTLIDARGDLLNEFSTTHLAVGGALRVGNDTISMALRLGLSTSLSLNDFEATNDIDCKFFGAAHPRCGSVFRAFAPLVWFGFDAGAALRWQPHRSWYLAVGAGISLYLLSPTAARELNYPFSASLGFGAAF